MTLQALAGYQQQDAHEYMQFILHNLHLENGGSADQSPDCPCVIHRTFYGKLQSTVTCDKCRNVTTALDPFMDLSLDLRNQVKKRKLGGEAPNTPVKLEDCLGRFTGKEKLAEAEYVCRNCGDTQQNATKQLSVESLPPVLSVHLKVRVLYISFIRIPYCLTKTLAALPALREHKNPLETGDKGSLPIAARHVALHRQIPGHLFFSRRRRHRCRPLDKRRTFRGVRSFLSHSAQGQARLGPLHLLLKGGQRLVLVR